MLKTGWVLSAFDATASCLCLGKDLTSRVRLPVGLVTVDSQNAKEAVQLCFAIFLFGLGCAGAALAVSKEFVSVF